MTPIDELAVTMLVNGAFLGIEKAIGRDIDGNIAALVINALKRAMEERNVDYDAVILGLLDEQADLKYGPRTTEEKGVPSTNPDSPQARR